MKTTCFAPLVLLLLTITAAAAADSSFVVARMERLALSGPAAPRTEILVPLKGRILATYDRYSLVEIPADRVDHLRAAAEREGFETILEESRILLPGGPIDPSKEVSRPGRYAHSEGGLFLLQFIGDPKADWFSELEALGVTVVEHYPARTTAIACSNDVAEAIGRRPWARYLQPFNSASKARTRSTTAGEVVADIQIANVPAAGSDSTWIKSQCKFVNESRSGASHYLRATCPTEVFDGLRDRPYVVSASEYVPHSWSDERQVLAIAGKSQPDGTSYLTWLAARGITPAELTASDIVVDVADGGLDRGCNGSPQHPDLAGREAYWNVFNNENTSGSDLYSHGTMVAGIVGGNGTVATPADSDSFGSYRFGLGVAPGLRIGSTKILDRWGQLVIDTTIADWARSAVTAQCNAPCAPAGSCKASVQNHSHNAYDALGTGYGVYTLEARQYDEAVRDANSYAAGDQELAIVVAAGNYRQNASSNSRVIPPATAKNVVSVGAAETRRDSNNKCTTTDQIKHGAGGYPVLAWRSQRSTIDRRYKPELTAPGTVVYSTKSQTPEATLQWWCGDDKKPFFGGETGTSYAAPAVAGTMAVLKFHRRKFYYHDPSPAMLKAMLVAGSAPMRGAPDRFDGAEPDGSMPNYVVNGWPGEEAGFGLVKLDTLLDTSTYHWWNDQVSILTSATTSWTRTFVLNDSSKALRVALAWTDVPGPVQSSAPTPPENVVPSIVNRLSLELLWPDCTTRYFGNSTDEQNNSVAYGCRLRPVRLGYPTVASDTVEVVNIPAGRFPSGTTFTIKISAALSGTARRELPGPNQDFALFVMNARPQ